MPHRVQLDHPRRRGPNSRRKAACTPATKPEIEKQLSSIISYTNPMVMKTASQTGHVDFRHVAIDTAFGGRDRAGDVMLRLQLMTIDTGLNVIHFRRLHDAAMRAMTGGTFHLPLRLDETFAPQHTNGLKPQRTILVVSQFLVRHRMGQPMTISTELDFRLGIPIISTDRKRRWIGILASLPNVFAARAVAALAVDVGRQIVDLLIDDIGRGGMTFDTTFHHESLVDRCEALDRILRHNIALPRRQGKFIRFAEPRRTMFDQNRSFGRMRYQRDQRDPEMSRAQSLL